MYGRRARQVLSALGQHYACTSTINATKPRSKSFEIATDDGRLLWSGVKKGPPRALKFPDDEEIVKLVREAIENK